MIKERERITGRKALVRTQKECVVAGSQDSQQPSEEYPHGGDDDIASLTDPFNYCKPAVDASSFIVAE